MTLNSQVPARSRVLLLENIHPSAREIFTSEHFDVEEVKGALKEDELVRRLPGVHVLGIRSKTQISPTALAAGTDLLAIGCFCIGTNQVDLGAARARGVPVFNAPFSNTRSVAELIIAEIIALARQLGDRSREVHEGQWRKTAAGCYEVRGKTLGIVGYGHIGSQVGVLAEGMGMRVAFYDVATKLPMGNNRSIKELSQLLGEADFVTLHVPETPQTRNLMGAEQIAQMRPGSFLLNASRGTVVDLEALAAAIRDKHIAGAAVDVFPEEPVDNNQVFQSELRGLPPVILTPHVGGSTEEAQEMIGREVSGSLGAFLRTGATTRSVNFPQVELAPSPGTHRIVNVHKNVPGVLRDINKIVSDANANIHAQMLATDPTIGYLLMDLDQDVASAICKTIGSLETSIRTRILY
jgi:D-3-phosphoglycerate dehydrogenase